MLAAHRNSFANFVDDIKDTYVNASSCYYRKNPPSRRALRLDAVPAECLGQGHPVRAH